MFQLEEVMETETYKNAKIILERFDPDSKRKMVSWLVFFIIPPALLITSFLCICRNLNALQSDLSWLQNQVKVENKSLWFTKKCLYIFFCCLPLCFFSLLELRQRNVIPKPPPVVVNSASGAAARPPLASGPNYPGRSSHSAPGGPPERNLSAVAAQQSLMRKPVTPGTPVPGVGGLPAHRGTRS